MKYEQPTLAYLDEATAAIQGDHGGPLKADTIVSDSGVNMRSSTAAGYPVEE